MKIPNSYPLHHAFYLCKERTSQITFYRLYFEEWIKRLLDITHKHPQVVLWTILLCLRDILIFFCWNAYGFCNFRTRTTHEVHWLGNFVIAKKFRRHINTWCDCSVIHLIQFNERFPTNPFKYNITSEQLAASSISDSGLYHFQILIIFSLNLGWKINATPYEGPHKHKNKTKNGLNKICTIHNRSRPFTKGLRVSAHRNLWLLIPLLYWDPFCRGI